MVFSKDIAEMIGIILGDGGIYLDKFGKYQTNVAFNKNEIQYLMYVKTLFESNTDYKFYISELKDEFLLRNNSVFIGTYLLRLGMIEGNKTKSKVKIPSWVFKRKGFICSCVRGLFDTDGCIYRKYGVYAQIQFKFACKELTESIRKALLSLKFNPTRMMEEHHNSKIAWKFYLTRQKEIDLFFRVIKPANEKNTERYKKIRDGAAAI